MNLKRNSKLKTVDWIGALADLDATMWSILKWGLAPCGGLSYALLSIQA